MSHPGPAFKCFDALSPVVSTSACFDELLFPSDHVGRRPSDTFYVSDDTLLRTHTTAHQTELLRAGELAWCVCRVGGPPCAAAAARARAELQACVRGAAGTVFCCVLPPAWRLSCIRS